MHGQPGLNGNLERQAETDHKTGQHGMIYLLTDTIEHWAQQTPDQPAFRYNGSDLSYAQLWRRAGQLAQVLLDQGVQRGDRVGIFMHKCLEMPLAVYAIMRAGAAFVPLDATAPAARPRRTPRGR